MATNPAREVRRVSYASDGFHTWTVDEVRQFEARHPIGTKARLALALLLYLGVRRGDLVTLGRQHVKDGWLRMVPRKTRHKTAGSIRETDLASAGRRPCADAGRRSDVSWSPISAAVHSERLRQLVSRALQ